MRSRRFGVIVVGPLQGKSLRLYLPCPLFWKKNPRVQPRLSTTFLTYTIHFLKTSSDHSYIVPFFANKTFACRPLQVPRVCLHDSCLKNCSRNKYSKLLFTKQQSMNKKDNSIIRVLFYFILCQCSVFVVVWTIYSNISSAETFQADHVFII